MDATARRRRPPTCCGATRVVAAVPDALAVLFKALGDGTRLQIVTLLHGAEEALCACDIESRFDLSQPTISHHLRLLREAGLVTAERRGTWMHYALVPGAFDVANAYIARLNAAAPKGTR